MAIKLAGGLCAAVLVVAFGLAPERARAQNFEAGLILGAAAAMMGAAAVHGARGHGRVARGHRVRASAHRAVRRPAVRTHQSARASASRDPFASAPQRSGGRDPFTQPVGGR